MITLRGWIAIGIIAIVLLGVGTCTYQKHRADRAEARLVPAKASAEALDKVATETPVIRQEQAEKEREVERIEGSETRLPDGYGSSLERVRRRKSNPHP